MTLAPEHIAAIIASIGVLIGGVTYAIKSAADVKKTNALTLQIEADTRAKIALAEAEREKAETQTDTEMRRKITDEVIKRGGENSDLQKSLRDCEVEAEKQKGQIRDLQNMNTALGERNTQQGELMKQSALRIESLLGMNALQETKIRTYELKYGLLDEDKT